MPITHLAQTMDADHQALNALVHGDPGPKLELFSRAPDVTVTNPLGLPVRGFERITAAILAAVARIREGNPMRYQHICQVITADLATSWRSNAPGRHSAAPRR